MIRFKFTGSFYSSQCPPFQAATHPGALLIIHLAPSLISVGARWVMSQYNDRSGRLVFARGLLRRRFRQIAKGIDGLTVVAQLEVQIHSTASRIAHRGNGLPLLDLGAFFD